MQRFQDLSVWRKSHQLTMAIYAATEAELEYFLILARDLGLLPSEAHPALQERLAEVKRMLTGLIKKLKAKP